MQWVVELAPEEEKLKSSMPKFRREVLQSKRLLVFRHMLEAISHENTSLVDNMVSGFDLTGVLPRSHVFISKFKPAEQSEAQLRKGATRLRDGLMATVRPAVDSALDRGVLEATKKELGRGFVLGPVPPSEVPAGASLTHRFGVIQGQSEGGPKVRPIDDYLASQVNATIMQVESVPVHSVDVVAGMLGAWLNEWFCAGRKAEGAPMCKAWDLRAAYKQLPLSDLSFEMDSHFVIYNVESQAREIYKQKVLPFGSKPSVSGFIRCAFALWRVGVKSLQLAWTDYFDDYLSTSGTARARHTEFAISMFFKILGWDLSVDKSLDYDAMCVILGVQLNLKDAMLGVAVIGNTDKRKAEALKDIDAALEANALDPKLSERLRGRLQFASCQVFGRRPKAALKMMAAHGRQRKWAVSESTRHALCQLRRFLWHGKPRPIRARKDSFVRIYVDASFEPEGHSGLGGVVFGPGGQALAWFGYKLDRAVLDRLLKDRDRVRETVIFELEALALSLSLRVFSTFVERRGAVIFTDNDGVLGSFIRGHSGNDVCSRLIDFFCQCEEELENTCWLDRVPSISNPSDAPSQPTVHTQSESRTCSGTAGDEQCQQEQQGGNALQVPARSQRQGRQRQRSRQKEAGTLSGWRPSLGGTPFTLGVPAAQDSGPSTRAFPTPAGGGQGIRPLLQHKRHEHSDASQGGHQPLAEVVSGEENHDHAPHSSPHQPLDGAGGQTDQTGIGPGGDEVLRGLGTFASPPHKVVIHSVGQGQAAVPSHGCASVDQPGDCGGPENSKGSCIDRWCDTQVLTASQAAGKPTVQGGSLPVGSNHTAHSGEGTCRDAEAHQLGSHITGRLEDQAGEIADFATGQATDGKAYRGLSRLYRERGPTTGSGMTTSSHPEPRGSRTPHPEAEGAASSHPEPRGLRTPHPEAEGNAMTEPAQLRGYSDPLPPGNSSKGSASVPEEERAGTSTGSTVSSARKTVCNTSSMTGNAPKLLVQSSLSSWQVSGGVGNLEAPCYLFTNRANYCYMNASAAALHWAMRSTGCQPSDFGSLGPALMAISRLKRIEIPNAS